MFLTDDEPDLMMIAEAIPKAQKSPIPDTKYWGLRGV